MTTYNLRYNVVVFQMKTKNKCWKVFINSTLEIVENYLRAIGQFRNTGNNNLRDAGN